MRDVAIVAFAQTAHRRRTDELSEVDLLMPVLHEVLGATGLKANEIGFTCSGSADYLAGRAFSFTMALDGVGAHPPISESHVEMDGAWALYEAWVKIMTGEADTALVYSYGKSSPGEVRDVLTRQLDPYYLAPLWPDSVSLAALQAQALIDAGDTDEAALASIAARSRSDATANPYRPTHRRRPCGRPPRAPATHRRPARPSATRRSRGPRRRGHRPRPVRTARLDPGHRPPHRGPQLGVRDLTDSPSARLAAQHAGAFERPVDTAELHAPFTSQEVVLRKALGLGGDTRINPSGGALAANPIMAAGLIRLGEAAARIHRGESDRALAHATSGPCLQQNLVAVLEGESAHA
ncbi:lipid-transfer protein [Streptomyces sp. MT29]|nr:lipid-transfer protein [Streptomyces sp. MT29]